MAMMDALAQMVKLRESGRERGLGQVNSFLRAQRMKELGNRFFARGDWTADGLQRFAQEENVQPGEMQALVGMVKQFREAQAPIEKFKSTPYGPMNPETGAIDRQGTFMNTTRGVFGTKDQKIVRGQSFDPGTEPLMVPETPEFKPIFMYKKGKDGSIVKVKANTELEARKFEGQGYERGQYTRPPAGMDVEMGPDGVMRVRTGVGRGGNAELTNPVKTKVQKDVLDTQESLTRLNGIAAQFKPEFQTLGTRWDVLRSDVSEKLGFKLNPEDAALVSDYSTFRMDAIDQINRYIKMITGAQMSEKEAERILKGMPNPGQGFFDGDGPTAFMAKMDRTIEKLNLAQARYKYMLMNGIALDDVGVPTLDQIPSIMNARGKELMDTGMSKEEVRQTLREEFGQI